MKTIYKQKNNLEILNLLRFFKFSNALTNSKRYRINEKKSSAKGFVVLFYWIAVVRLADDKPGKQNRTEIKGLLK